MAPADGPRGATPGPRVAALVFAAGFFVALGPALLPGAALFWRDHTGIFFRLFLSVIEAYGAGEPPLWDPYTGLGEPLAGYPNSTAWSPLLVVFALPGELSTRYDLFIASHVLVAAIGMRALARAAGVGAVGAWVSATAYALSGLLLSLNNLVPNLLFAAFCPLAMAFALRFLAAPTPGRFVALSVSGAILATVGLVEMALCAAMVFVALASRRSFRDLNLAHLGGFVLAVATTAALAAPHLLLVLDVLAAGPRGSGFSYELATVWQFAPAGLGDLLIPGSIEASGQSYLESLYLGPAVLALVAAGARRSGPLLAAAALSLLLAFGSRTPLHGWVYEWVPLAGSSRYPVKYLFGVALAVAIVAGRGFDALWVERDRGAAVAGLVVAGLALVAAALAGSGHGATSAVAIGLSLAASAGFLRFGGAAYAPSLALAGVAMDLGVAAGAVLPVADAAALAPPAIGRALIAHDPAPVLFAYQAPPRSFPTPEEMLRAGAGHLEPWAGVPLGVRYAFDADANSARSHAWQSMARGLIPLGEPERLRVLGRLGVTHLIVEADVREAPGLEFAVAEPPVTVFRLRERRPFVSAARGLIAVSGPEEALEVMGDPATPFDRVALEGGPPDAPARGEIVLRSRTRHAIHLAATSTTGFVAVLAQSYDPGWEVEALGERGATTLSTLRAEGVLTGVAIPPGAYELILRYRPRALAAGLPFSLAAVAVLLGVTGLGLARRRIR